MCAARPATRGLFTRCLSAAPSSPASTRAIPAASCHHFHSSVRLAARRKPRFSSIPAAKMGLVSDKAIDDFARQKFPELTEEEKAGYRKGYSPEHIAALEAGEAAISPRDLTTQGRLRLDPYRMQYIDDFNEIQPILDKRQRTKPPPDPNETFFDIDQFAADLAQWGSPKDMKNPEDFAPSEYKNVPISEWPAEVQKQVELDYMVWSESMSGSLGFDEFENLDLDESASESGETDPTEKDLEKQSQQLDIRTDDEALKFWMENSSLTGGAEKGSQTALAPALPNKVPGVAGLYKKAIDPADEGLDDQGAYRDLKQQTGLSVREIMDITTKTLVTRWVANQTRLGKIRSASVIVCAGNRNGWLGIGMAKSVEMSLAATKARMLAIRNMRPVPRYENRTIYGNTEAKVGATVVQLFNRPPGFGLRVSHRIFEMCRAAGIWDLSARMPRSRNPMNSVKATYEALMKQADPNEIARGRSKKLVDARKVYYGGAVY